MNPTPYRIATPRLVLRCWEPGDGAMLKAAVDESREHLARWLEWARQDARPIDEEIDLCRRYRGFFDLDMEHHFAVLDGADGAAALVGGVALHDRTEIGYWIHVAHQGRGYATEAVAGLCRAAFSIFGCWRLVAHADPGNAASLAVLRRVGFALESTGERLRYVMSEERAPDIAISAWDVAGRVIRS